LNSAEPTDYSSTNTLQVKLRLFKKTGL